MAGGQRPAQPVLPTHSFLPSSSRVCSEVRGMADGAGRMSLGVRGGRRRDTPDEWAAAAPDPLECPLSGHKASSCSIPESPSLQGPGQEGCPQTTLQGRVPLGTGLSGEQHQERDAAQLPPAPGSDPRSPLLLCQLFLRTRKGAGSVHVKIEAPASQDRPGGGRPHVFLLLQAGLRHAWCGQGAHWGPLPLSCAGTPGASIPGGTWKGPRAFRAGTALGLLRVFRALEPPPAGRSFLPGLAESG